MADATIATAADYADALITARRAKQWLFLLLLLMLLIQIGVFLAARYTNVVLPNDVAVSASTSPTTLPTNRSVGVPREGLRYLPGISDFAGIALFVLLSMVLLLIVKIMLVGRTLGVARTTSAYIWSLLLVVLLFPWQAFLDPYVFKIPGVLYTWDELLAGARFTSASLPENILKWARFVA